MRHAVTEQYTYRLQPLTLGEPAVVTTDEYPSLSHIGGKRSGVGTLVLALRRLVDRVVDDLIANGEPVPQPIHTYTARPFPAGTNLSWAYCPAGWGPHLDLVTQTLDTYSPTYELRQVKVDFGHLDIHTTTTPGLSAEASRAIGSALETARERAVHTCEVCSAGDARGVTTMGWLSILCQDHADVIGVPVATLSVREATP